jgi:hypothetical protein
MKIPVFILTYLGMDYLNGWFNRANYPNHFEFFIVDNGQQRVPERLQEEHDIFVTTRNIGCSGGYNVMMSIGFDLFSYDKIILAQDDGKFTTDQLEYAFNNTTKNVIQGVYGNGFPYAICGMMKYHRDTVGRWDENYIYQRREDNDYTWRCNLLGIQIRDMGIHPHGNVSVIPDDVAMAKHQHNIDYYYEKWGNPERFVHPFNNPFLSPFEDVPIRDSVKAIYGDIREFPSITEFSRIRSKYGKEMYGVDV